MITLTNAAVKELKRVMSDTPESTNRLLRVSVSGGGCSGFQYQMGFVEKETLSQNMDNVYSQEGIDVVVDKGSEAFISGTTIGWYEDLTKRGFTFENPNSSGGGGCRESFNV